MRSNLCAGAPAEVRVPEQASVHTNGENALCSVEPPRRKTFREGLCEATWLRRTGDQAFGLA